MMKIDFDFCRFIQQEVQNLLHELERRDNECRRLSTQATTNEQQLEKTSDKLQSIESKSVLQAKEIRVRIHYYERGEKLFIWQITLRIEINLEMLFQTSRDLSCFAIVSDKRF